MSTSERKVIGTPGEYNLGLIVLLSSNQNPVILLSVNIIREIGTLINVEVDDSHIGYSSSLTYLF